MRCIPYTPHRCGYLPGTHPGRLFRIALIRLVCTRSGSLPVRSMHSRQTSLAQIVIGRAVFQPADAFVDAALAPVQRDCLVQKIGDAALPWVALGVRLLLGQRGFLQFVPEDQFLPGLESCHGFSPQLPHLCGGQVIVNYLCPALKTAIYGPVTAVSGGIAEEIGAV